jgi:hypothetical protein
MSVRRSCAPATSPAETGVTPGSTSGGSDKRIGPSVLRPEQFDRTLTLTGIDGCRDSGRASRLSPARKPSTCMSKRTRAKAAASPVARICTAAA